MGGNKNKKVMNIEFEMRLGNWYLDNGEPKQWNRYDYTLDTTSYSPIPLSPDVLKACGFVNSTDVHWCVPSNDPSKSFEICVWSDHVSYTMSNHFHLILNSLHQLQNLFFALTGQELSYTP